VRNDVWKRKRPLSVFNTAHKLTLQNFILNVHFNNITIIKNVRSGDMICNYFICCNEVQLFISI